MDFNSFYDFNRNFETWGNDSITPEMYIIIRLDGRSFSKLTKDICGFAKPFDSSFRDLMVNTTEYLFSNSGFRIAYAYTQSDEISLLLERDDNTFNRRPKKIATTLAATASAYFSLELSKLLKTNIVAVFDGTLDIRPTADRVVDYFLWRQQDSYRNCLNGYVYWTLIKEGKSARSAGSIIDRRANSSKQEILFEKGINFNDVPSWQKSGVGLVRTAVEYYGYNPILNERVASIRNIIEKNYELPIKNEYAEYVRQFIK